jgi:Ni/Co efflux regulator RcnB
MKKLFGALLLCGFLTATMAQAAQPVSHPKVHQNKAAKKQAAKVKKQNAKARKAAKRKANAPKPA